MVDISDRFDFNRGARLDLASSQVGGKNVSIFRKRDRRPIKVALFQTFRFAGSVATRAALAGVDRLYLLKTGVIFHEATTRFESPAVDLGLTIMSYDILGLRPRFEAGKTFAGDDQTLIRWQLNPSPETGVKVLSSLFSSGRLDD